MTRKISRYVADLHWATQTGRSIPKLKLGNLSAQRDWGHAEDYVEAMWLMLQHEEPDDFVIATGVAYEITHFLKEAFSCIGLDQYQKFIRIDSDLFRPSEVPYLRGSANKAKTRLGWMPSISFEELVSRMVEHDIIRSRGGCLQGSSPS